MFEGGQPAYAGFQVSPIGPVLSNPMATPGAVSQVAFLADRIQFREEKGTLTHEAFAARVREIAERAAPLRNISTLAAQQVVLQSLVNPRTQSDTREFLKDRVFGFGDELQALGRSSQLVGLRLGFGPESGDDSAFGLRIESYSADPRSLYIEVQGTFGPATPANGLEALERNVVKTYDFLAGRVLPFISSFDRREGGRNNATDED